MEKIKKIFEYIFENAAKEKIIKKLKTRLWETDIILEENQFIESYRDISIKTGVSFQSTRTIIDFFIEQKIIDIIDYPVKNCYRCGIVFEIIDLNPDFEKLGNIKKEKQKQKAKNFKKEKKVEGNIYGFSEYDYRKYILKEDI